MHIAMAESFGHLMLLHMVVAATALFWAWRRGHLSREKFPVETILGVTPDSEEEENHVD
mgnify:CR=1 FL=1